MNIKLFLSSINWLNLSAFKTKQNYLGMFVKIYLSLLWNLLGLSFTVTLSSLQVVLNICLRILSSQIIPDDLKFTILYTFGSILHGLAHVFHLGRGGIQHGLQQTSFKNARVTFPQVVVGKISPTVICWRELLLYLISVSRVSPGCAFVKREQRDR